MTRYRLPEDYVTNGEQEARTFKGLKVFLVTVMKTDLFCTS
jgi:hypothetical protein